MPAAPLAHLNDDERVLSFPSAGGAPRRRRSPPQAQAANAAFLAYAPPPPGGTKALCLVDTGVNPTPDTTPGLVFATALDGGIATDVDPLLHGTIDAAIAAGAGHGVLGAWPQLKPVSVRATDNPSPGQLPTFHFDDYGRGQSAPTHDWATTGCHFPRDQAGWSSDLTAARGISP